MNHLPNRIAPHPHDGREHRLADAFVLLADTLVNDFEVAPLLDLLVTACVQFVDVSAAGVLLSDQRGNLEVVASSTEPARLLSTFQVHHGQGPGVQCVEAGRVVLSDDLEADPRAWPEFARAALAVGVRSVTAIPLRLREQVIGGLTLFRGAAGPTSSEDQHLARALADVATIGILQRRTAERSATVADQLQHALNSRVVIEQAKGVLAERDRLDMTTAFEVLRHHARSHNLKLADVAAAVVRGELNPPPTRPAARPTAGRPAQVAAG
jgi:GAF domain-containing protein